MSRKKANIGSMDETAEMDMSPMIDMVFLLLIFFVVNATAITVKTDKSVKMPIASQSGEIKSANGYIVLNFWGTTNDPERRPKGVSFDVFVGDDNGNPLPTAVEVEEYIKKTSKEFEAQDIETKDQRLYIRGDQDSVFKHSRKAIGIAGGLGISNVVFGVIPTRD